MLLKFYFQAHQVCAERILLYIKKLLTRTALAATIALGIGSFNLAYAAETEDTSSGKKINVMASFYPMYDFATKVGGDKIEVTNMVPAF